MNGFTSLLVHTVDVYARSDVNTGGRIAETWNKVSTIPCRFSSPVTTRVTPAAGASVESIDATVFTGPELLAHTTSLPVRFVTTDAGWSGTYELRKKPRILCAGSTEVHHCECDVIGVQQ